MNKQQKADVIEDLKGTLARAASLVVTTFEGLTVKEANELRSQIRKADCKYRVIKNTLFKLAVEGTAMEGLAPIFKGTSGIAYSLNDPVAPARVVEKFVADNRHIRIKGGYVDGKVLDAENVQNLAKMKGKDELRGELLMMLLTPAQGFLRLLGAGPQNFMYLLQSRKQQLEDGTPE